MNRFDRIMAIAKKAVGNSEETDELIRKLEAAYQKLKTKGEE